MQRLSLVGAGVKLSTPDGREAFANIWAIDNSIYRADVDCLQSIISVSKGGLAIRLVCPSTWQYNHPSGSEKVYCYTLYT